MTESRAELRTEWRLTNQRAGLKAVQRWRDGVAGDTLARGHVDKGDYKLEDCVDD